MKHLKKSILAVSLVAATFTLPAAPLQRPDAPADPAWIAHLDCDALRTTTLGQFVTAEMEKPEAKNKLASFEALFGFDLRKQLHGLTLYNQGSVAENAVLLIYADFDAERLANLAKGAKDYKSSKHNQHQILNWIDEKKKEVNGAKPRTYAAIHGKRLIFGQNQSSVAAALDVIDGITPSLAKSRSHPQLGATGNGNFIQAAVHKFDVPSSDPNAAVIKMSNEAQLQIEELNQQFKATLNLAAKDQMVASNITQIAQGLIALMRLQTDKPESASIAKALNLQQTGSNVVLTLAMPANEAVEIIKKADAAKKAAHTPSTK